MVIDLCFYNVMYPFIQVTHATHQELQNFHLATKINNSNFLLGLSTILFPTIILFSLLTYLFTHVPFPTHNSVDYIYEKYFTTITFKFYIIVDLPSQQCEVAGSDSFIFILNNCRMNMSLDEDNFFSDTACNFSHKECQRLFGHVEVDVLSQMHSDSRPGYLVHGTSFFTVIEVGLVLCLIASTCRRMMTTSCIISFHKAKLLPSNFRISTFVPDFDAIFVGSEICWPCLFFSQFLLLEFILMLVPDCKSL